MFISWEKVTEPIEIIVCFPETAENGNIDEAKIKAQDASPGTDKKPNNLTKEDKEPNQVQHGRYTYTV